mmetsp:Transcript_9235/g.24943  ORF Transcript_9235/g.24943 Transcript_9235/m.24943 type:complete len:202 (+) Transcript_9235:997-1602(+)
MAQQMAQQRHVVGPCRVQSNNLADIVETVHIHALSKLAKGFRVVEFIPIQIQMRDGGAVLHAAPQLFGVEFAFCECEFIRTARCGILIAERGSAVPLSSREVVRDGKQPLGHIVAAFDQFAQASKPLPFVSCRRTTPISVVCVLTCPTRITIVVLPTMGRCWSVSAKANLLEHLAFRCGIYDGVPGLLGHRIVVVADFQLF